ncbi:TPA: hypothetical protein DCX15_06280, partial [bacterium]|nr:hypothetical protein [bacterium]
APLVIEEPKISLDVKNADLLDVLRLIGHKAAVNIVPSKDVSGTVTIRIENTPWEQVLDVVLRSQGYIYFHDKGLIRVGREEDFVLEMTTQIIPLKYAKASDIVSVLQPHIGKGGGLGVDERTNSLIITDTPKNVVNMREIIIKGLDIRTRQVLIEAKIVQVSETGLKQLGIRWVVDDAKDRGLYTKDAYAGGRYVDKYTRGTTNPGIPDRDPFGTFSFGFVSGTFNIDAALAALESQGEGSILSSPSVLVAHNQKATITSGKSIPMLTTTAGPGGGIGQTVTYRDVCITMTVTPKIAPDDYISLKVNPRVESVDEVRIAGYPDLTTSSIETDLLVRDGDTVVIGGVIKDEHTQTIQKVPFLGDIPFLGRLFQGKKSKIEKSELLIFIRTKIIRETE